MTGLIFEALKANLLGKQCLHQVQEKGYHLNYSNDSAMTTQANCTRMYVNSTAWNCGILVDGYN